MRPLSYMGIKNWPWSPIKLVLPFDYVWDSGKKEVNWESKDGILRVVDGVWHISKGYQWDGTTAVPDGLPDPEMPEFPESWRASLIHDLGYQYTAKGMPYTRKEIDLYFYEELKKINAPYAQLYYLGVRWFGGIFKSIMRIVRQVQSSKRRK